MNHIWELGSNITGCSGDDVAGGNDAGDSNGLAVGELVARWHGEVLLQSAMCGRLYLLRGIMLQQAPAPARSSLPKSWMP